MERRTAPIRIYAGHPVNLDPTGLPILHRLSSPVSEHAAGFGRVLCKHASRSEGTSGDAGGLRNAGHPEPAQAGAWSFSVFMRGSGIRCSVRATIQEGGANKYISYSQL